MTRPARRRRGAVSGWLRSRAAAFTIVEVLLALALTLLVLAAVVPLSASLIERADERAVVDRLSAGVRLATAEAARSGAVVTLCARERRGLEGDLVLQFAGLDAAGGGAGGAGGGSRGVAPSLLELGVELPRGWRVESVAEDGSEDFAGAGGERAAPPSGSAGALGGVEVETLTPIGTALPDGRFVCMAIVVTTGVKRSETAPAAPGEEAPARFRVAVDALSGRVSVTLVGSEDQEETAAPEGGDGAPEFEAPSVEAPPPAREQGETR